MNDQSDARLISNDQIEKTPTDEDHSNAKGTDSDTDKDGAQDQKEEAGERANAEPAAKGSP